MNMRWRVLLLPAAAVWAATTACGDSSTADVADADADLPDRTEAESGADADGDADADADVHDDGGFEAPDVPGTNPPEPDEPADDLSGGTPPVAGACREQGLDELCRRRDAAPAKPFEAVIDADGWSQPETVVFHDTVTGAEVVRATDDPAGSTTHCHINRTTFNADGSYLGFLSRRCWPDLYCPDNFRYVVAVGRRGPHVISVPREHMLSVGRQETWDPFDPDVLYFVNHGENEGLYRVRVADGAFSTERLVGLPNPDRRKHVFSNPGPDGTIVIKDTPVEGQPMNVYVWHPARPGEVATFDLALGVVHPDHSAAEEWHTHDFTLRRNPENTIILNYGPEGSAGEPLFIEVASDGSQAWRILYANNTDTRCPVPYLSHPAWNLDGSQVLFGGTEQKLVDGTNPDGSPLWTWNDSRWGTYVHAVTPFAAADEYAASTLVAQVATLDQRLGHFAWDGFDPRWTHGAPSGEAFPEFPLFRMAVDGSRTESFVTTYARSHCGDSCDYCSLPRPAQSPDATKVAYHSDMLQHEPNAEDVYLAVHRYPFAPVWLGLANDGELRLAWRLHDGLAREIRGVRLLRSPDVSPPEWTDLGGVLPDASFLDPAPLADGESALYAATAVEHSGLESRSLSRIVRVTRAGDAYRADMVTPYGTRDFDRSAPGAPTGLTATSPAAGQVRLAWTAPSDVDVRLFHVYASTDGPPDTTQAHRIASLPAGHPTYLDWGCGSGGPVSYAVTAVDYQGNESAAARTSAIP